MKKSLNKIFFKYIFTLILFSLFLFLGILFIQHKPIDTEAKTTNNTYHFYVFALGESPQSYAESTPGIFSTNDFVATTTFDKSPGTFKVDVEIVTNGGGGCSATPSASTDASVYTVAKGSSYAHGFTGQKYSYSVTYSVKPNAGFQVYSAGTMKLLNPNATSTSSSSTIASIVANEEKSFSNVSGAWVTPEQSVSYTFSLGSHTGFDEINNDYYFYWVFAPIRYTVTYKNGSSTFATRYVDYCSNYVLPSSTPTKEGCTFKGWYTASSGGDPVTSSTKLTTAGNVTLYAQWDKIDYYVDVNNYFDGVDNGAISKGLSFSVKVDNKVKSSNVSDFYQKISFESEVEVYDIKINEGYVLDHYEITVSGAEQEDSSSTNIKIKVPAIQIKILLYFTYGSYNLEIDPGGGVYNGSSSVQTITQKYLTTTNISVPTREGYDFAGWVVDGGYGTLSSIGKVYYSLSDQFLRTNSSISSYDQTKTMKYEYFNTPYDDINLPSGARVLKISNTGANQWGQGFTNYLSSYANAVFYTVIQAKIPVGYSLQPAYNAHGDGASRKWLTSNAGTGEWETYVLKWQCGGTGSFATINYFFLQGPSGTQSNPTEYYISYFGTYDATGLTANENIATNVTYTFGGGDARLVALWTKKDVTVNLDLDGGLYDGETTATITTQYKDLVSLSTPTREGYSFKGWEIASGSGVVSGSQYLYSEETFDGSTDYLSIGRDKMYSDKITISLWAYMDNWANYGTNQMRLISCTETGGWNLESSNGTIAFACYDKGYGYKSINVSKTWSSLSSGWHSFTAIFDGLKAILYIDNQMIGCSAPYTSGQIGYNSNNVIFIGAEAANNATTPYGQYFNGKIRNVVILNEYAYGTQLNQDSSAYLIVESENITIKALWEENAINNKSDSFVEEDGWVNISNANDLARLAYLTNYTDQSEIEGKQFRLTANIDLSNTYWEPIGTESKPFKGVFDGNGYSIIGLHNYTNDDYKYSNSSYIGLFGCTSAAEISHVVIEDPSISGDRYVGGIAGKIDNATTLTNCYVTGGDITSYSRYAGGIVGYISQNSNVVKCISTADVTGYKCVAGLVGGAVYGGTIMTSYAMSNLTLTAVNMTENGTIIGGASTTMSIADCFFVGTSNKEIGTYYGSKYVPQSINSCYAILNDVKTKTAGGFTNWTIFDYLNNGMPIQTELIYLSNGVSKPDEVMQYLTDNAFTAI